MRDAFKFFAFALFAAGTRRFDWTGRSETPLRSPS